MQIAVAALGEGILVEPTGFEPVISDPGLAAGWATVSAPSPVPYAPPPSRRAGQGEGMADYCELAVCRGGSWPAA